MKIHLWRNATLLLTLNEKRILIDPMLGAKGSIGLLPMLRGQQLNPLVNLPFNDQELRNQLQSLDAVLLTHLHPDHWDIEAQKLISKELPIICSPQIAPELIRQGFTSTMVVESQLGWEGIQFHLTKGRHGTGEIGTMMGAVNGFFLETEAESLYLAGDTIWYEEIELVLKKFRPAHIVLNGGAAQFDKGEPVIMDSNGLLKAIMTLPSSKYYIVHLEALSHCRENRVYIQSEMSKFNLNDRCVILKDGEVIETHAC